MFGVPVVKCIRLPLTTRHFFFSNFHSVVCILLLIYLISLYPPLSHHSFPSPLTPFLSSPPYLSLPPCLCVPSSSPFHSLPLHLYLLSLLPSLSTFPSSLYPPPSHPLPSPHLPPFPYPPPSPPPPPSSSGQTGLLGLFPRPVRGHPDTTKTGSRGQGRRG